MKIDPVRFSEAHRTTESEIDFRIQLDSYFSRSIGNNVEKLQNFSKYVPVQDIRRFLTRAEVFRRVLSVHGSIVECGILFGGGLMTWAHLSEVFEPFNHLRNIIGFDTFSGFPSISEKDRTASAQNQKIGGLAVDSFEDIQDSIALHDQNRVLKQITKVRLVKGDIAATAEEYLEKNPHTVIALLWLDFDTYEPTKIALKHFLPRMPKGSIICFDELNHEVWPGETVAVAEEIGINKLQLERLPWGSTCSFAVL